jgi:hypothetical protein
VCAFPCPPLPLVLWQRYVTEEDGWEDAQPGAAAHTSEDWAAVATAGVDQPFPPGVYRAVLTGTNAAGLQTSYVCPAHLTVGACWGALCGGMAWAARVVP